MFHGSPQRIEVLEPRQAVVFSKDENKNIPDGEPAVAATPFVEVAIFRSLINTQIAKEAHIAKHRSEFGVRNSIPYFRSTLDSYNHAKSGIVGFVHVLRKSEFTYRSDMEYRSIQPIIPVMVLQVTGNDLPENIEIIEYPS